jgi:hypothetical protein
VRVPGINLGGTCNPCGKTLGVSESFCSFLSCSSYIVFYFFGA